MLTCSRLRAGSDSREQEEKATSCVQGDAHGGLRVACLLHTSVSSGVSLHPEVSVPGGRRPGTRAGTMFPWLGGDPSVRDDRMGHGARGTGHLIFSSPVVTASGTTEGRGSLAAPTRAPGRDCISTKT